MAGTEGSCATGAHRCLCAFCLPGNAIFYLLAGSTCTRARLVPTVAGRQLAHGLEGVCLAGMGAWGGVSWWCQPPLPTTVNLPGGSWLVPFPETRQPLPNWFPRIPYLLCNTKDHLHIIMQFKERPEHQPQFGAWKLSVWNCLGTTADLLKVCLPERYPPIFFHCPSSIFIVLQGMSFFVARNCCAQWDNCVDICLQWATKKAAKIFHFVWGLRKERGKHVKISKTGALIESGTILKFCL